MLHGERVCRSPKFTQSGALTRGSLMFSMEVCAQIIDGVMYVRKWWILSSLTVWSVEINLCHMELLRPSTVCPQDAALCHFFLSVSFFSSYNPDHVNINRDVQHVEMVPLNKGKEILLTQKMAPFQQSSQKDSLHLFLFKLSIPATHTVHIQHGGWQYYNVVHRAIQEMFQYVLLMDLFIYFVKCPVTTFFKELPVLNMRFIAIKVIVDRKINTLVCNLIEMNIHWGTLTFDEMTACV